MSNKKFTVLYNVKNYENILVEKNKKFDTEDQVIDFIKSLKLNSRDMILVGKPTIICN